MSGVDQRRTGFEPGSGGRGEVNVEARPLGQPVANQLGFMGAVDVQNQGTSSASGTFFLMELRKPAGAR